MSEELSRWVESMTRSKAVLVVDDDFMVRMMFKEAAEGFNLQMDFAPSANEARQLLRQKTYDVVFLDMKLENGVSGMEVLQFINAAQPTLHVVVMSGSVSMHDIMHEANALGVLSFIRKPVSFTIDYLRTVFQKIGFAPGERSSDDTKRGD